MCWAASSPGQCEDFAAINARARASILQILVTGTGAANQETTSPGTGFVVHADAALPYTFVFTAAHVIGRDDDWLLNNDGKPVKRKIVVRQSDGTGMVSVSENAEVVGIDHSADVAVIAIPKRPINPIPVAGYVHLKELQPLMANGFPANENKQVPIYCSVRTLDYSRQRIEIDRFFASGQSGAPVIDGNGWAVGIASENNDKLTPTFHRAAVVSAAVSLLNSYLSKAGRPQLVLKTHSDSPLSISTRSGRAKVRIAGDTGALAGDLQSERSLTEATSAELNASGEERSECDEASGRTRSNAQAHASVQLFENNGLKIPISLAVQGGHYRTATTCIGGKPVGLTGHDTEARASADVEGQIDFDLQSAPADLRVVWQDVPPGTRVALVGPDGAVRKSIEVSGTSEQAIQLPESGHWRLQASISRQLRAKGGSGQERYNLQSILLIALR
ncbi:trypsin-like peptidase domain-containing protein [Bradyrhizobium sp. 160]|uniref:S1 family peptidase n=1 Tax=Bradyrhizobium sp. 160 TaxID=2782634 RepID=UPI001FF88931|nr:serine protease [Bradyrhizobium sp. 160]MCK1626561.1 trypsin-like peptidase domain-containing protein [Bradyrhizobium sp. 160]